MASDGTLIEPLASYVDVADTKAIASCPEYQFRYWADSTSSEWMDPPLKSKKKSKFKFNNGEIKKQ